MAVKLGMGTTCSGSAPSCSASADARPAHAAFAAWAAALWNTCFLSGKSELHNQQVRLQPGYKLSPLRSCSWSGMPLITAEPLLITGGPLGCVPVGCKHMKVALEGSVLYARRRCDVRSLVTGTDDLQCNSLVTLTKVPLVTGAAPEVMGLLAGGNGAVCRGGEEVYVASDSERDIGVMGVVGAPASALSPGPPLLAETGGEIPYAVPLPLSVPGPVSPPEL